ncbi:DUF2225 domain-containing protein [Fusibacter ferrireducens]|uniref:DUF2225 domain-containing protein n=1 Tax=Fusibacter ferrireducens TaxID=2785058 RepID=A0ABR9ZU92_9FIRM|nr:DUF2225 domain-containing protein [Fusibacter ferrireducens]MBF4694033.1 DUF2225 domain-containing protein [Fusibacter ferrireducens]
MSDLFDRKYTCGICGNQFTSKQVKTSALRVKSRERDFHAYYNSESPIYYGVICCPNCGYAKFERDFKMPISSADVQLVKSVISSNWRYQDFCNQRDVKTALRVHMVALANYKVLKVSAYVLGKLYLRLAWFYREEAQHEEELKYLKLALDAFVQGFETEKDNGNDEGELETIYIVGELNRRIGNYQEAIKWFSSAVNHELAYKNRMIKNYARDQWALCAEAYKMEKNKSNSQGA